MLNSFFKKNDNTAAQEPPKERSAFQHFQDEKVVLDTKELNELKGGQVKTFTKFFSWNTSCGELIKQ